MSVLHTNNITNYSGTGGPTIAGISTVDSTGFMKVPVGDTRTRLVKDVENIVTDGLVLHLDAGRAESFGGDGTTWRDLSGNGNNGTLVNGVGFTADDGGSLIFDGVNDYVRIKSFDHTATNTVEMWFKQTTYVTFATPYVWGFLPTQRWQFKDSNENMYIYYDMGSGTSVYEDSGINVTTTEGWAHIIVTADYNNNQYKSYKNGSLIQTGDLNDIKWSYRPDTNGYNFIDMGRNVTNNNGFLDGNISTLRIYTKVLSASEVLQNYEATKGRYL